MAHIPVLVEKVVNVHEVELKTPPLPPSSQVTVPVGRMVSRPGSLTLALNVMAFPIFVVAGLGVMVVVVAFKEIAFASWDEKDGAENIISNSGRMKIIFLFIFSFFFN